METEIEYRAGTDRSLALARAVIVAERMYDEVIEGDRDALHGDVLLLLAHLRVARQFSS